MEAYADLVGGVGKTVDQFMADNVPDDQARDYLAATAPELDVGDEQACLHRLAMAAAGQRVARERQQLLATMVLMGINRIVVDDGEIHSPVCFDTGEE